MVFITITFSLPAHASLRRLLFFIFFIIPTIKSWLNFSMNLRNFIDIWSLIIFFLFLANTRVIFAQRYITWDDIKVDYNSLDLTNERSRKSQGVIVVDQHGNGDSITAQGAVDMVPLHNSQRVRIFIRPGTYRYFLLLY